MAITSFTKVTSTRWNVWHLTLQMKSPLDYVNWKMTVFASMSVYSFIYRNRWIALRPDRNRVYLCNPDIMVLEILNLVWFHKPPSQSYLNVTVWSVGFFRVSLVHTLTRSLVIVFLNDSLSLSLCLLLLGSHRAPGSSLSLILSLSLSLSFCLKLSQDFSGSEPSA